jgi:Tol biopolymer transport system component
MYNMLFVLVREHGQIVDKEKLLKEVWPDSFVEEGNISFNIRQLRKLLNDNAQSPMFIETVPRRGYRFIAEVEEVEQLPEPEISPDSENESGTQPYSLAQTKRRSLAPLGVTAFTVLFVCAAIAGGWYLLAGQKGKTFRVLSEQFSTEKLSTTGLVFAAAVSPDGENVVYSSRQGAKQGLWLRHLPSANNVEIIPPTDGGYYEIVFSPDGNSIYFSRGRDGGDGQIDIYRTQLRGGIPEKIVNDTEGWLSVSADGGKISYVRCPYSDEEFCSLWIADSRDGGSEKKLVSRPRPLRIGDNEISPDGTKVVFAAGQSRNQANEFRLMEVDIESGVEREVTAERFFNVKSLTWLPDQSGLLLTASRIPNKYFRIWQFSTETGKLEPLTADAETYSILSLDSAAEKLVSTQIKQDFRAYGFDMADPSKKQTLADATSAKFAADGKIYFSSTMSGNDEIWSMNSDGSNQRQLTNDPADDREPVGSPDGKTVYFTSNRTGQAHIWKMAVDGSDPTRLTQKEGGMPEFASTDGSVVYYRHAINGELWSVSLENGEELSVLDHNQSDFAFTPDGQMVAYVRDPNGPGVLVVTSLADRSTPYTFRMPGERDKLRAIAWMPDARSLLYAVVDGRDGKNKIYRQQLTVGSPQLVADLEDEDISELAGLSVSPDGKSFVLIQGGWKHDAVLIKGLK